LNITKHLTYREGHVGSADGLAIEAVDLFTILLAWDCLQAWLAGTLKRPAGLAIFLWPIALGLLADLLSFGRSVDLELSVYAIVHHLKAVVMFVILATVLSQGEPERRLFLKGIALSTILIGAICVAETVQEINWGLPEYINESAVFRAAGLTNPTLTGGHLSTLWPLLLAAVIGEKNSRLRSFWILALVLGSAGIVSTMTRTALVTMALTAACLCFYFMQRRLLSARLICGLALMAALALAASADKLAARDVEETNSVDARTGLNRTALAMSQDSPIVGQGLNTYTLRMRQFTPSIRNHDFVYQVHNKFLLTLAETGWLGLGALVWLVAAVILAAVSAVRRYPVLGPGLLASLLAFLINMNMEAYEAGPLLLNLWSIFAFTAAMRGSGLENAPVAMGSGTDRLRHPLWAPGSGRPCRP
jgi:O-antigen ligase